MKLNHKVEISLLALSLIAPMSTPITHADSLTKLVNKNTQSENPVIHKEQQQENKNFDNSHQSLKTALHKVAKSKTKTKEKPIKHSKKFERIYRKEKEQKLSFTQKIKYHFHKFMSSITHGLHHSHRVHKVHKAKK